MRKNKQTARKTRAKKIMPSRKYVNRIMDWCLRTYGRSKYNREFPEVHYRSASYLGEDRNTLAFYDDQDGIIYVNKSDHKNLSSLANSIIHEYTHYKQNMRHYDILSRYLPYHRNPLEIEANRVARRDTKKCLKEIFAQ